MNTSPREEYEKYLREGKLKERKLARKWYVTEDSLQVYFEQPEEPEEGRDGRQVGDVCTFKHNWGCNNSYC